MRKAVLVLLLLFVFLMLLSLPAAAQPTRGDNSTQAGDETEVEGRNDAGYGGGPHCHVLIRDTDINVYPSHQGHDASGLTHIFTPTDCEGNG